MEAFKERLLTEEKELSEKIVKLTAFVTSDKLQALQPSQRSLLKVQLKAMETYNECLRLRLELL